ncbi:MAG: hypothetical protein IKX01_04565 [Bacteroidales bacterium]|nr:hypothetical protein [Bacteroidales bacterium]
MKRLLKITIMTVLVVLVALSTASCKKQEVKKIAVDNQFAIAIFNDTISVRDLLNDLDSTCNSWLRVRNDSIFAYYADSVNGVLKASDLLDAGIEDIDFTTVTSFTMPMFDPTNNHDTVIEVEKFMTVPFDFDGFDIDSVLLRKGVMSFGFSVEPQIEQLRRIEIFSNELISPDGEPLVIPIDYNMRDHQVNLANYRVIPVEDTVSFGARITLHVDSGVYLGGDYECTSTGGLTGVGFKTVYALVTKTLDSIFSDNAAIDFGINGLSGSAWLPVPRIHITYRNTFGMMADGDITTLEFFNSRTGLVTDLLAADHVDVDIYPTNGLYRHFTVTGFTDQIDALAGYTRLDFDGQVTMAMPGDHISISDTSSVDVIADVEMPFSFKITDLRYTDTININFGEDVNVNNYFDEIKFFIDYDNKIPLEVQMQGLFMRHGHVIDSLFDEGGTILYNEPASLTTVITDRKLSNVMRADQMILRLGVNTDFQEDPVLIRESNNIALRMRMLTKTTEINIGGDHHDD